MKKKITIIDVANDCGFSTAMVSKYLNNKPMNAKTRKTIERSIQKLHYSPTLAAQNMRTKKHSAIVLIIPPLDNSFWGILITHLEEELRSIGYSTIILTFDPNTVLSDYFQAISANQQFDGAIIVPLSNKSNEIISYLSKINMPYVLIDQVLDGVDACYVTSDNFRAVYEGTCYLIRKGHKRIAALNGSATVYTSIQRKAGFIQAMKDHHLPIEPEFLLDTPSFNALDAKYMFRQLMALAQPPTAVFSLNAYNTIGCIMEASASQIRIPEDLSLLSFDDDILLSSTQPKITAIAQDVASISHKSIEILMKKISGEVVPSLEVFKMPTLMLERESVKEIQPLNHQI